MLEHGDATTQPYQAELLGVYSPASAFGPQKDGSAFVGLSLRPSHLPSARKQDTARLFTIAILVSVFAVVFFVSHCLFRSRNWALKSFRSRSLASGGGPPSNYRARGTARELCGELEESPLLSVAEEPIASARSPNGATRSGDASDRVGRRRNRPASHSSGTGMAGNQAKKPRLRGRGGDRSQESNGAAFRDSASVPRAAQSSASSMLDLSNAGFRRDEAMNSTPFPAGSTSHMESGEPEEVPDPLELLGAVEEYMKSGKGLFDDWLLDLTASPQSLLLETPQDDNETDGLVSQSKCLRMAGEAPNELQVIGQPPLSPQSSSVGSSCFVYS